MRNNFKVENTCQKVFLEKKKEKKDSEAFHVKKKCIFLEVEQTSCSSCVHLA